MELATVLSRAQRGIESPLVRVEVHISNGLPAFNIVGLPAAAVRESKERVRSAIINSHFEWPDRRLTINLAPADLPKDGGRFDLPIALGILVASEQVPEPALAGKEFIGELALNGALRAVSGSVSAAVAAVACQRCLVLPGPNAGNPALVPGARVVPISRFWNCRPGYMIGKRLDLLKHSMCARPPSIQILRMCRDNCWENGPWR